MSNDLFSQAFVDGDQEAYTTYLLENINCRMTSRALRTACQHGHLFIVNHLLGMPEVSVAGALDDAAKHDQVAVVDRLLQDPRVTPDDINNAMRQACRHGSVGVVQWLLCAADTDPTVCLRYSSSLDVTNILLDHPAVDPCVALDRCLITDHNDLKRATAFLLHPDMTAAQVQLCVRRACWTGNIEALDLLLSDKRALSSAYTEHPLFSAAKAGHISAVERLLENAYMAHYAAVYWKGGYCSAMEEACTVGYTAIVERLLCEPFVDASMSSYLVAAAARGHTNIVALLIKAGSDPSCRDGLALYSAAINGHASTVELLLRDVRVQAAHPGLIKSVCATSHVAVLNKLLLRPESQVTQDCLVTACLANNVLGVQRLLQDTRIDPGACVSRHHGRLVLKTALGDEMYDLSYGFGQDMMIKRAMINVLRQDLRFLCRYDWPDFCEEIDAKRKGLHEELIATVCARS